MQFYCIISSWDPSILFCISKGWWKCLTLSSDVVHVEPVGLCWHLLCTWRAPANNQTVIIAALYECLHYLHCLLMRPFALKCKGRYFSETRRLFYVFIMSVLHSNPVRINSTRIWNRLQSIRAAVFIFTVVNTE